MKTLRVWVAVITASLALASTGAAQSAKKIVHSEADLPRFSYPVKGTAVDLLEADDKTFNAFAAKVRADVDQVLTNYDIQDKATLRSLLALKLDLQQLAGENEAALKTADEIRGLQEKPASKLLSGMFTRARLQAAIETRSTEGAAYVVAFKKNYRASVEKLPWDVVQDPIKSQYANSKIMSKALLAGDMKTEIQPAVDKSGALNSAEAADVISDRADMMFYLPLEDSVSEVLRAYISAHNVTKPDIWAAREVTFTSAGKLTPVPVAIWDSGIDLSIYPQQTFDDPKPTASGTHGLAYDDKGLPSTDYLYPLTPEQQKEYPEFRDQVKGMLDLENNIDSPEADAVQKTFKTMNADQLHEMFELQKVIGFYIHGTHCAGIASRGNPAAQLVVMRFNDQLPDLPFPPTEEWARKLSADFQQMSDYFNTRHVRVVNMSWGDEPSEFELWLSKTGGGADPAGRKKKAAEIYAIWKDAIETAIKNAPNTLFVTAAGNSNSNAGFTEDVPASLQLPNLITVGAVNQSGDETSFTSYGETVVLDADGYNVESYVPGGAKMKLSGTSMASPNVVNLAAKLFALDPALTPEQVIDLMKRGATTSEDGRRHLIDEKRSVELLAEMQKK